MTPTARVIDGRKHAAGIRRDVAERIRQSGIRPSLAVILIGDDPASALYVTRKAEACEAAGIQCRIDRFDADTPHDTIADHIRALNADAGITGVLMQLPLPAPLKAESLIPLIDPAKDVDGLTPLNIGRLVGGLPGIIPCTPQGVLHLLKAEDIPLEGRHAVILGRSLLFGRPMGQLLLRENCTVTHCHARTVDVMAHARQADILISATGQAGLVRGAWVKPGACVIDVGINRMPGGRLCGDVAYDEAVEVAGHITPVPGGVGPMTVACLMKNCVETVTDV